MTLFLNGWIFSEGEMIKLVSDKHVIQSGEYATLMAILKDGREGVSVYFYEEYEPFKLNLTGDKSIIQVDETLDLTARLKDEDGSLIEGEEIYFYEEIEAYEGIAEWTETGYATSYYPTPLEITGQMKSKGNWGGLRIYGEDNSHNYVYLGQGNASNDEYAKIFYKIGSDWTDFKILIGNCSVSLYINSSLIQTVSTDTTGRVNVWGGSNANKVSVKNVIIKEGE